MSFIGCLVISVIGLVAPTWTLPLFPESLLTTETNDDGMATMGAVSGYTRPDSPQVAPVNSNVLVTFGTHEIRNRSMNRSGPPTAARAPVDPRQVDPVEGISESSPSPLENPARATRRATSSFSWTSAFLAAWLGGVVLCLLRTAWQQLAMVSVLRQCTRIGDEEWARIVAEASRSQGLSRPVQLLRFDDARSPLSAGILQAAVVLPGDVDHWDTSRRRLVLLHELAHVKRRDVLTQTVARFVCALHWFNPICWFGLFQMRRLRELACDDLVLASGQQPGDYADVLLHVARSYLHSGFATTVGMVRSANVERRILAVLDKARSHVSLTRRADRMLLMSASVFVVLIGSMQLQSRDVPTSLASVSGRDATKEAETPNAEANKNKTDRTDVTRTVDHAAEQTPAVNDDMRTMEIRIRDEDGQPIEGARLFVGTVRAYLGPWEESRLTSSQAIPLDLQPGDNRSVTLGGDGIAVTGKVVATGRGDAELNKNWSLNYLIRRDRGIDLPKGSPNLSFNPAERVQASWFLDPNHSTWLATREKYFVKLAPDGQLLVSGVPLGVYDLVLRLYEQPTGCLVETVGEKVVTIEITDSDVASGGKDIGTIEVECRAGPRVGENMQLYRFTDTKGRGRSIKDMRGQYVLMHVWATWCVPCLQSIPDMQATIETLTGRPITLVGLNIDDDAAKAQSAAHQHGWNWSQNYLGDESDLARQLAISSVPTYFLIGPDGRLAASTTQWSEMKVKIKASLERAPD